MNKICTLLTVLTFLGTSFLSTQVLALEGDKNPISASSSLRLEPGDAESSAETSNPDKEIPLDIKPLDSSPKDFASPGIDGFGFGAGIGINILNDKDIGAARIDNNVVRVTSTNRAKTQFWLEAHYNFGREYITYECKAKECLVQNIETNERAKVPYGKTFFRAKRVFHGPFFAINVSDSDSVMNGAALGYMLSLRKVGANETPTGSYFNIGIGISTARVQTLANGLKDGDTVAAGTQLEFRTDDELGLLLLLSVGL